nr:hypothetical protein [Herbaspirillum sp. ASV7]
MQNWSQVRDAAIAAAKASLGGSWGIVAASASAQISGLVECAKYIDENRSTMSEANYRHLLELQETAVEDAIAGYEAIGIVAAQKAAEAAINVIVAALPGLLLGAV